MVQPMALEMMSLTFRGYWLKEVPKSPRTAFLQTLDEVYRRSKEESRQGFPHVKEALEGINHETEG